jgi:monomeric isocitrate dehydrogenase
MTRSDFINEMPLRTGDVARHCRVCERTVQRWVSLNGLPRVSTGRFRAADVNQWLDRNRWALTSGAKHGTRSKPVPREAIAA